MLNIAITVSDCVEMEVRPQQQPKPQLIQLHLAMPESLTAIFQNKFQPEYTHKAKLFL